MPTDVLLLFWYICHAGRSNMASVSTTVRHKVGLALISRVVVAKTARRDARMYMCIRVHDNYCVNVYKIKRRCILSIWR